MARFEIVALVVPLPFWPASPMKNTRKPVVALVEPPFTVILLLPPSILVLLPRMSGSSLFRVMVWPAIVLENVICVRGLALAKVMASRNDVCVWPNVSALVSTVQELAPQAAPAGVAPATASAL